MSVKLSLSSCWLSHRHTDGYEMLREISELGFEWVELSHGIKATLVPGILKAVNEGVIKVSSVHNFCPLPSHINHPCPNLYEPTSRKQLETLNWYHQTSRTLQFANEISARNVVLHSGSIHFGFFNPVKKIHKYSIKNKHKILSQDPKYISLLSECYSKIKEKSILHMQQLVASINTILPLARDLGVKLCFENREDINELPLDNEFHLFLDSLNAKDVVGYWHDTGHAQIKEDLDIISQKELLETNFDYLEGFHLQNVIDGEPHQPLMKGSINFDNIKQYFKPDLVYTLELSPHVPTNEIMESRDYFYNLLN